MPAASILLQWYSELVHVAWQNSKWYDMYTHAAQCRLQVRLSSIYFTVTPLVVVLKGGTIKDSRCFTTSFAVSPCTVLHILSSTVSQAYMTGLLQYE